MELKTSLGKVIFSLEGAKTVLELLTAAVTANKSLNDANLRYANLGCADLRGADLRGADLRDANLSGAVIDGRKIEKLRVFTGLYRYHIWAVLFADGARWVRMGCLWKSLEDWEKIGIRKSDPADYPDDGSDAGEERVLAFEFARAAALRLKP